MARASSTLLLLDAIAILATIVCILVTGGFGADRLKELMTSSPLPLVVYGIWGLGLFGSVGALVAIAVYGYRSGWFWWCLLIAAASWLLFPPVHTVIGLVGLVLLLKGRRRFIETRGPDPTLS